METMNYAEIYEINTMLIEKMNIAIKKRNDEEFEINSRLNSNIITKMVKMMPYLDTHQQRVFHNAFRASEAINEIHYKRMRRFRSKHIDLIRSMSNDIKNNYKSILSNDDFIEALQTINRFWCEIMDSHKITEMKNSYNNALHYQNLIKK